MTKTVIDETHLDAWRRALDELAPPAVDEPDWEKIDQIDSFRPMAMNVGMVFRMRRRNGEIFEICMNPVAARHMAACILLMGQEAGWLNASGEIICPPLSFDA